LRPDPGTFWTVWTHRRYSLTLRADGTQEIELAGASPFPRHWVYDGDGRLIAKSATLDWERWCTDAFGRHTPWGDTDSPVLVSEVESAAERNLSMQIMRPSAKPRIRRLRAGEHLTTQGEQADEVFLVLDGILRVDEDGSARGEIGPGAVVGEGAILESGHRTASLTAVTKCTVAVAERGCIDVTSLERIAEAHRLKGRSGEQVSRSCSARGVSTASAGAFVLDLCDLDFLDSSGLRLILRARALLARGDRELAIVCPPGPVRRLFELAGIADLLFLYASRAEAAAALVATG
jgi:anti-anti-sigma factor